MRGSREEEVELARLGTKVFVSYRGEDYESATALCQWLADTSRCERSVLVPPGRLAREREILMPSDVFELMEHIGDELHDADAFVLLDNGAYWNSYWTRTEVLQWRRFSKSPEAHVAVTRGRTGFALEQDLTLEPLTKQEARMWARISTITNPRYVRSSPLPIFLGRFARSCFLVPSVACGRQFLATRKAVRISIANERELVCPYCATAVELSELDRPGSFHRKPIVSDRDFGEVESLDSLPLLDLLTSDDLPAEVELVTLPGERLQTDAAKVAKAYGWLALGAGAALVAAWARERVHRT